MIVRRRRRRRQLSIKLIIPTLHILLLLLLNNVIIFTFTNAAGPPEDMYCGTSWPNAADSCSTPCAGGKDDECTDTLGTGYSCHFFTGCAQVVAAAAEEESAGAAAAAAEEDNNEDVAAVNNFCAVTWVDAMLGCASNGQAPCPDGTDATCNKLTTPPERCWAATNCDKPLEQLVSELLTTMTGPDQVMEEEEDINIFEDTFFDTIRAFAIETGIHVGGVNVGNQAVVGRRELEARVQHRALMGGDRYINFEIKNTTVRRLPSGSSAIDVSMVVTGDYRPPPYLDLDVIAEDSINRQGAKVVDTLRERGERAGREFFSRVEGIEAVRKTDLTKRPTKAPIKTPTMSPFGEPTDTPSGMPTDTPTSVPSTMPSRTLMNVIMTGSRQDLQLGAESTSSYGYIWNIRTKPDAQVVQITGMDFYTETTDEVNFELWTRLGSFKEFKGTYDGWDLIAVGATKGRGIGRYTAIPEDTFTPISIPGGGESRAFYLTLDTINLVYKYGEKGDPSDLRYHHDSEDIEIWEGEGVLFYPFPDPSQAYFYREPRQYLGAIYYDRLPCKPYSLYGDIDVLADEKCPRVPTQTPTLTPPTLAPITQLPTLSPVEATPEPTDNPTFTPGTPTGAPFVGQTPEPINPTEMPTLSPTLSSQPTPIPTTAGPTLKPVVPKRANIITTFRNVPQRMMTEREVEKYIEILSVFLRRHTGSSMVLAGIEVWHQDLTMTDAKPGTVVVTDAKSDATVEDEEETDETKQSPQVARGAANRYLADEEVEEDKKKDVKLPPGWKKRPPVIPQVDAMDVTLILLISYANLPDNLLGNLANVAIEEHEQELLDLLHEQQAFYTFFKLVDGVSSRTILEVTNPPTPDPTTVAYYEAQQAALEAGEDETDEEEEESGIGFAVFIGLGIGFLWCCLTAISVACLISARGEMEEQRDMENLLKAEKSDPLNANDADGVKTDKAGNVVVDGNSNSKSIRRSSTIPLGYDSDDSSDPFDHTKNTRLAAKTRVELSQSTNSAGLRNSLRKSGQQMKSLEELEAEEDAKAKVTHSYNPKRQSKSKRAASVIVTSQEKKTMLEGDSVERGVNTQQEAPHRHSAGAELMGKDTQRKSLTRQESLKSNLKEQRERARSIIQQSGSGLRSSGNSLRQSAARRSSNMRASTASVRRSSNLRASSASNGNMRKSSTLRASSVSRSSSNGRDRSSSRTRRNSEHSDSISRASSTPRASSRTRGRHSASMRHSSSDVGGERRQHRSSSRQKHSQSVIS